MAENLYPLSKSDRPVCDQFKSPLWILGMGVALLRQYFGSTDRIAIENSLFRWQGADGDDVQQGQVYIGYADNFDVDTVGKRPALIVGTGDQEFNHDVIGDRSGHDPVTGAFTMLDRTSGTLEILCLSERQLETTALATEVKYFLQTYRQPIKQTYGLLDLRVMTIGRHQAQKEYQDSYGRLVTARFSLQDNFSVGQESLRASAIRLGLDF